MGRVAHSRLDELRKCAQPMSWMDDDEVIDVLNELWSARETINDVSAKLIQDERQLAAQAAEIERLTKEAAFNSVAYDTCPQCGTCVSFNASLRKRTQEEFDGGPPMTQPEDDAARLARECSEAMEFMWHVPDGACGEWVEYVHKQRAEMLSIRMDALLPIIRAHLAERDARERMVREQVKALMSIADAMTVHDEFDSGRKSGYKCALLVVLEIIDAKSDEQTPTTTGGTNES